MDLRLALMCGTDIPIPELQITLHQPTIKEIAYMGESDFFVAVQCLNVSKDLLQSGKVLLDGTTNFQIFMMIMQDKEAKEKKMAVQQLLAFLFPGFNAMFTPRSMVLSKEGVSVTVDESNFSSLQNIAKEIFCVSNAKNQQNGFNPANEKAREIANKLMRGRQRVAEINGQANKSIFGQYLSILAVGLPMSLQELMDLTMYQIYDLIERYQLYIGWDIDLRARMAGAKMESQPDNWMKNIH